jgi:DNA-directed RNA polymerase specialized sigma24 family protein
VSILWKEDDAMTSLYTVDDDLILGLVKGDEIAFDTLINKHGDHILRACYIILKDSLLAEDKEKYQKAYESISYPSFRNILRQIGDYYYLFE